jgi:hypothetical protein
MCYGNATKSLEIARERMTAERWEKFEADFEHFRAYSGLPIPMYVDWTFKWAKWAFLCGRKL